MKICLSGHVGRDDIVSCDTQPSPATNADTAWVNPGGRMFVTLRTLYGDRRSAELRWGRTDHTTGALDYLAHAEGMSFAWPCLIHAYQVRQACDVDDAVESVTYTAARGYSFAGAWISENPHVYRPVAFKLLTVASGPDLARYCSRQPLLIDAERAADWFDPTVSTKELQRAPAEGWVTIQEVTARLGETV